MYMIEKETDWREFLTNAGVKPTRPRMLLARELFERPHFHFRADEIFYNITQKHDLSLATVYNTLDIFVRAGLLRAIPFTGYCLYDTNATHHHHFWDEENATLIDIDPQNIHISSDIPIPAGKGVKSMELLIRLS